MWASDAKEESLNFLYGFTNSLSKDLEVERSDTIVSFVSKQKMEELSKLLARCYFKQGEWQVAMKEDWGSVSAVHSPTLGRSLKWLAQRNVKDILRSYLLATHYDPTWYKAWHTWALANFEVVSYTESQNDNRTLDIAGSDLVVHIVQAVEGGFEVLVWTVYNLYHLPLVRLLQVYRTEERERAARHVTSSHPLVQIRTSRRCQLGNGIRFH